jgi:hypothetical protein
VKAWGAGCGASRNGKYYWYVSPPGYQIGVSASDTPRGPWIDPLGKPLIAKGDYPTTARDPDIFTVVSLEVNRFHGQKIDHAPEIHFQTDRHLHGDGVVTQFRMKLTDHPDGIGAGPGNLIGIAMVG